MPNAPRRGPAATREPSPSPRAAVPTPVPEAAALSSVDNALLLLQLVGDRHALRVAEAADVLGVARSTAHRLLTALRRRGFVVQDRPNGAYRPGPALYEIGLSAVSRIDIRQVARPVLEQIREETEETVSLALLEGTTVRFIDCAESGRSVRVGNRTGVIRPAHASAVGKAILSGLPEAELERRYTGPQLPPATTAAAMTELADLRRELAEIRIRGYALNWEESTEGVCAIAVALRDTVGQPLAGLGIAAPASRIGSIDRLGELAPVLVRGAALVLQRLATPR